MPEPSEQPTEPTRDAGPAARSAGGGAGAGGGVGAGGGGSGLGSGQGGASGLSSVTLSHAPGQGSDRQTFAADELAIVLSHYDIGVIEKLREFPRGSRKAPKLLVKAESGPYLLKRRALGKDDPEKIGFCHGIQLHLASKQFPLPHLIRTRHDKRSLLRLGGHTYELFEYIQGTPYDQSLEATQDAGKALSLMHKLLGDYDGDRPPASGSYHDARSVYSAFAQLPHTLSRLAPQRPAQAARRAEDLVNALNANYVAAVKRVEAAGLSDWPGQIVHSDWHPGNMLFRGKRVVAVIDYDTARVHQRVIDIANGALQFSILGGSADPSSWPEGIDLARFKRFLIGYDSVPDNLLSRAELRVIPWLMMQALIAESVIPIAKTGRFARMDGEVFLEMVRRKNSWLVSHADQLVQIVDG